MLFKSKRKAAYDASAAAALIAIIGALIVLYILFIPPEERDKILGEDENGISDEETEEGIKILLSESPKRLIPSEKVEFEQDFTPININVDEEGIELKSIDSLYASRSIVSNKQAEFEFEVIDLENVKAALLNFVVEESQGRLTIVLNDKEIFNKEIVTPNINPVDLKGALVQGNNKVEFIVSSPGAAIWRTNSYSLTDVLITADMLRRDAQKSELTFVVDSSERENLKRVKLHFLPECEESKAGALSVLINNYNLYSAVPECSIPHKPLQFLPERLVIGENRLIFSTTKSWYMIDNIRLTSDLKDITVPVYYFELDDDEFKDVEDEDANVTLYMRFADDDEEKVADISINNHILRLDQEEIDYNVTINNYVEKGNNAIKIEVEKLIDIVELKVKLES